MLHELHSMFVQWTCDDVARLIVQHMGVSRLQRAFRAHMHRHCSQREWNALRCLLVFHVDALEFDALARERWVRHEWLTEPSSWIYMLRHEPSMVHEIARECAQVTAP